MTAKLRLVLFFLSGVFGSQAMALTIGPGLSTEVGDLDVFVHVSTKNELANSSPATEQAWIESILGGPIAYSAHGNNVPIVPTNEDPTIFAWALPDINADYFLIKNAGYWALFQNMSSKAFAVVDADSGYLPDKMNFGNATISHFGIVQGGSVVFPPQDVPVPATLLLLLVGFGGLGWSRRKAA